MDASNAKESAGNAKNLLLETPKGTWGTVLTTTPIVLTVLATAFAGLSSSEMTQSMYYRSLAAQHQSKAGDQWAFFQAKRIRGTSLEMTVQLLRSLVHPDDFDPVQVDAVCAHMQQVLGKEAGPQEKSAAKVSKIREELATFVNSEKAKMSLPSLTGTAMPKVETHFLQKKDAQEAIEAVVKAIENRQTEGETAGLVAKVNPNDVEEATRLAEQDCDNFDKACEPIRDTGRHIRDLLEELGAAVKPFRKPRGLRTDNPSPLEQVSALFDDLDNSFKAASMSFEARRYGLEANLNRRAAEMYEVQVRRSGLASDRHRERSKNFFYSMLIAQAGVTISSLAVAKAQRSLLWLVAALAGVVALGFSGYVYLLY